MSTSQKKQPVREIWKPVPGYVALYAVSNLGNVKRLQRTFVRRCDRWHKQPDSISTQCLLPEKLLTLTLDKHLGYIVVGLRRQKKTTIIQVHQLVLLAFRGKRPKGLVTRHLNGNRTDNKLSNLRWGTPSQNQADRIRHGTGCVGEDCYKAKLSNANVRRIRGLIVSGKTPTELAKKYHVAPSTICDIKYQRAWRHVV